MRRLAASLLVTIALFMASCSTSQNVAQSDYQQGYYQEQPLTYDVFYNNLSPYGTWTSYAGYGNVWVPYASAGFRPYETNGYWVSTNTGWAWVSNYNWGWAPFHYGRWFYEPAVGGWAWVPGYDWAPAWVQWGRYDNYYAWAPLAPGAGYGWNAPYNYWCMAPTNYITRPDLQRHIVRRPTTQQQANNIQPINNYNGSGSNSYNQGPSTTEVAQATGRPVKTRQVQPASNPGATTVSNNQFGVYRPELQASTKNSLNAANNEKSIRQQPAPNADNSKRVIVRDRADVDVEVNRPQRNIERRQPIIAPAPMQRLQVPPAISRPVQPRVLTQPPLQRRGRS